MAVVKTCPLMADHTFREKEPLMLRIAEEANLHNIRVKVQKSCTIKYEVAGPQFFVSASLSPSGWIIRNKICIEDDDIMTIPLRGIAYEEKSLRCPFTGLWLGKILLPHLELCPGMSYLHMRSLLVNHAATDLIGDSLLQEARNWAMFSRPLLREPSRKKLPRWSSIVELSYRRSTRTMRPLPSTRWPTSKSTRTQKMGYKVLCSRARCSP